MPISAVDLFCGVGGLTHGLQLSGIPVVAGLDVEHSCQYAYEQNNNARFNEFAAKHIQKSVRKSPDSRLVLLTPKA